MSPSEQAKAAQKKRQSLQKEIVLTLQGVFASPDGKVALSKISQMCNEHEPTYVDQNPNGTAYKEGQRSVIIGIRKMMNKTFSDKVQEKAELKGKDNVR